MIKPLLPVKVVQVWLKIPLRYQKILKITGIVFASLVVLMLLLSLVLPGKRRRVSSVKTTPAPVLAPTPEAISNPSRYATDSAILKIEEDLAGVEKDLDSLEVNEINLLPPRLDFDINFEK